MLLRKITISSRQIWEGGTISIPLQTSLVYTLTDTSWTLIYASILNLLWCAVLVEKYENLASYRLAVKKESNILISFSGTSG